MQRDAEIGLLSWFRRSDRRPLVLRGARQVGKSTLVRLFCKNNGIDLIEINLEIQKLRSTRKENLDLPSLLDEIQLVAGRRVSKNTLIFLDEIQEDPKLLSWLRYFYEQRPELPVIAAGSLLEIALGEGAYAFPVGRVEFYHLGPMTFSEFLTACGKGLLRQEIEKGAWSEALHTQATELLKKYFYVGGMPKVVLTYSESSSIASVREIQNQLIQTYVADFPKYNRRIDVSRVSNVFLSVAGQVGKKVIYQNLDRHSKSREIRKVLELLIQARVLLPCYHAEAGGVPLEATKDENVFKLYFLDVGLLNCLLKLDYDLLEEEIDSHFVSKGVVAEQFAAQHLCLFEGPGVPPHLSYWLREKGTQKGEVDFLVEERGQIIPIEVKSASGGRLKSLFYFAKEKGWDRAVKLSMSPFSKQAISHEMKDGQRQVVELTELPLYAVENLAKSSLTLRP